MPSGPIGLTDIVGYALGALCLALLSVGVWRYAWDRRATAREITREQRARLRDLERTRNAMDELLRRLEETAGQIDTQAEQRIATLQALIREADEHIARLAPCSPAGLSPVVTGPTSPPKADAVPPTSPPRQTPAGLSPPATPDPRLPQSEVRPTDAEGRKQRIVELADAGMPRSRIAEALGIPFGEVELVLNLRDFARQTTAPSVGEHRRPAGMGLPDALGSIGVPPV